MDMPADAQTLPEAALTQPEVDFESLAFLADPTGYHVQLECVPFWPRGRVRGGEPRAVAGGAGTPQPGRPAWPV